MLLLRAMRLEGRGRLGQLSEYTSCRRTYRHLSAVGAGMPKMQCVAFDLLWQLRLASLDR